MLWVTASYLPPLLSPIPTLFMCPPCLFIYLDIFQFIYHPIATKIFTPLQSNAGVLSVESTSIGPVTTPRCKHRNTHKPQTESLFCTFAVLLCNCHPINASIYREAHCNIHTVLLCSICVCVWCWSWINSCWESRFPAKLGNPGWAIGADDYQEIIAKPCWEN